MIVPRMEPFHSNSHELSNQRSVIAKSVSNQVVPVSITLLDHREHLYEEEGRVKGLTSSEPYASNSMHSSGSPGSPGRTSTPPLFLVSANSSPDSPHSSMPSNGSYDFYCGYELLKGKRKPIPVPSESKDDAYWERRRRNNLSGKFHPLHRFWLVASSNVFYCKLAKVSREHRKFREVQTNKRIMYLEQENVKLQTEVGFLREELNRLREKELLPYLVRRYKWHLMHSLNCFFWQCLSHTFVFPSLMTNIHVVLFSLVIGKECFNHCSKLKCSYFTDIFCCDIFQAIITGINIINVIIN